LTPYFVIDPTRNSTPRPVPHSVTLYTGSERTHLINYRPWIVSVANQDNSIVIQHDI